MPETPAPESTPAPTPESTPSPVPETPAPESTPAPELSTPASEPSPTTVPEPGKTFLIKGINSIEMEIWTTL